MNLRQKAFTLVELMISIALMVGLMIAVNYIFGRVSQATGAGQALSRMTNNIQSAGNVLSHDFSGIVAKNGEVPCILLMSRAQPAFRNKDDESADIDKLPLTADLNSNNVEGETSEPGEITYATRYNDRNHRVDIFSFFANGLFPRQTGNDGVYVADQSVREAWIWYGHLKQPDSSGAYPQNTRPGAGSATLNPNNYYAQQWILGRVAMLLVEPQPTPETGTIADVNGTLQHFIRRRNAAVDTNLTPLQTDSDDDLLTVKLPSARYDLAGTSISTYRGYLEKFIQNHPPPQDWWTRLMLDDTGPLLDRRFHCNPIVSRPIDSKSVAGQAPIFLPACTQFIVEYAGDYLQQDSSASRYGQVMNTYTALTPSVGATDGEMDYQATIVNERRIRWYGFPRDINGDGKIDKDNDVVPLRDIWQTSPTNHTPEAPFERAPMPTATPMADYGSVTATLPPYFCAWGPNDRMPSLIRITMVVDDPNGRLNAGQTLEFIFKVK